MALQLTHYRSLLDAILPRISVAAPSMRSQAASLFSQHLARPLIPSFSLAVPAAIHLNVPSLLAGLWESVLRAVPKKKTSHMKKRHRFMAGKALKDVTNLNRCSACGNVKRAHLLCPFCVRDIKDMWLGKKKVAESEASKAAA